MKPSASCWRLIKVARFRGSGLPLSRTFGGNRTFGASVDQPAWPRCGALPGSPEASARHRGPHRVNTLVIGVGQAGPATSNWLTRHGVEQVL